MGINTRSAIRDAIDAATRTLAAAGIDSARVDAELLAAHIADIDRGMLGMVDPADDFFSRYRELVDARARRIPLQHLTGTAPFGPAMLHVGPGVFTPRPETEALLEWAVNCLGAQHSPTIVDLCTGTGALAVALAHHRPRANVIAVDDSPPALHYAERNAEGTGVRVVEADVTDSQLMPELDADVDLVVANPPYIPDGAQLEPEVAEHDPAHALFGGPDGMRVVAAIVALAGRWLRPGGHFAVEHDDTTSGETVELICRTELFGNVEPHTDLAGRPRFVTAVRNGRRERS